MSRSALIALLIGIFALFSVVASPAAAQSQASGVKPHPGTAANHAVTGAAHAASFTIGQLGHPVGTAGYRLARTDSGYDSTSTVQVSMQGLQYALSKNEQLDPASHIQHEQLSATVNGSAVNVTGKPDATGFLLNISANGRSSTTRLAAHSAAIFLPDFDPGALETLLTLAAAQNGRDLWAILPKQAGSIEPVQLATYADEQGTLDGKPVSVHHVVATIAGSDTDLFTSPENHLLQAELPQQGFSLVRKGFVLTPPRKPGDPPSQPASSPQPGAPPAQ